MNKDELKNKLSYFKNAINSNTAELNVMLIDQNNQRNNRYKGLMLKTTLSDLEEVIKESFSYLFNEIDKRTLDPYDLEISIDESIQMVKKSSVIHGDEILSELTTEYNDYNVVSKDTDLSKIKLIVIQIYANDESLYLFMKYMRPSSSYKTSQKYILSGGLLKPFKEEIITISPIIDAMLVGDTYYIFNRNSFNSIFAYRDVFTQILNDSAPTIINSGILSDPETFINDCESDGRYLTRLTKVILAKGFEEITNKKQEIPSVIKEFSLSLKATADGQIEYNGKEDIPELLNLLLRHYVIDALTSNKMVAAAIQNYQAGSKEVKTK